MLWLGEAEGAFKVLCCRSPFSCQTLQRGETQPSLSGLNQLSEDLLCYYYYTGLHQDVYTIIRDISSVKMKEIIAAEY